MSRKQNDGYYEVLWPRAERQVKRKTLATRLDSLEGKTVAQLWDFIFRGDEVFDALEGGLKARYPGINFISWRDFGNMHGREERQIVAGLPQRMKELGVDAVISAMAC